MYWPDDKFSYVIRTLDLQLITFFFFHRISDGFFDVAVELHL